MAAVAGALVGIGVVAALVATDRRTAGPVPDASSTFVEAWRRSLTETYWVRWQFSRHRPDGSVVATAVVSRAQRPPDVVVRGPDGVRGRVGGRRVGCLTGPGGPVCRDGGAAPPYVADVEAELGLLRALVAGPGAAYRVRAGPERGCFVLVLRARLVAPPYGEDATFCFDARTGALARSVVRRPEVTDTHVAVALRGTVRPEELVP